MNHFGKKAKLENNNRRTITVYLDSDLAIDFKLKCTLETKTMTEVIEKMVKDYVDGN